MTREPWLRNDSPTWFELLLVLAGATGIFLLACGPEVLNPTHTAWMMSGDAGQHYLGWQFFRHEPWHWPPGRIEGYGYPVGTAITFTDGIPLLAMLFKLVSGVLPAEFQYFGPWMLACYALSGYFGLRVLSRFTCDARLRVLGALFFVLSPPVLLRTGGHESLVAHWLLIAGIDTHLRGWSWGRWLAWCGIAALCHPYLLLMTLGLMGAAAWAALRIDRVPFKQVFLQGTVIGAVVISAMGLVGYFSGSGSVSAGGYGFFSMNVLALIDPWWGGSAFLKARPTGTTGQYEGLLYLGAGMILLGALALGVQLTQSRSWSPRWKPLAAAATLFWVLALSNAVWFGGTRLFLIELPPKLMLALSVFRASGRFGWPAFYLLTAAILVVVVRQLAAARAAAVFVVALAFQVVDQKERFDENRSSFHARGGWKTPLQSAQWEALASSAKRLIIVPPHPLLETIYGPFAHLCVRFGLVTNAAHSARASVGGMESYGAEIASGLKMGRYDPLTIYVFPQLEGTQSVPEHWREHLLTLDGYWVLPSGLNLSATEK